MKSIVPSFALVVCMSITGGGQTAAAPPNILILIGDDIDRDSLSPWGGQAQTPHLDQLAAEGIRLDNAYANVAMCAPFRQELYSGRCVWRTGAMPNHSRSAKGTKSLPHYLRPLGYRVGLLGKKHIGPTDAYPFDNVGKLSQQEDANPLASKLARDYVVAAREASQPFCLVVASHDGHAPYTTGDPSRYDVAQLSIQKDHIGTPQYRDQLANHLAEVTNLDKLLGDLRQMLAEERLDENTLVLFCSEQGSGFPFAKWTCFDDGLATGIVAALPGAIPAGSHASELTWLADIAPTLVTAAGGSFTAADFDGGSQWEHWLQSPSSDGSETKAIHDYAYGAFCNCRIVGNKERNFPIRSIRDRRYSLVWSPRGQEARTSNLTLSKALKLLESNESDSQANAAALDPAALDPAALDPAASWVLESRRTKSPLQQQLVQRLHHRPEWALYDRDSDSEELRNLINDPAHAPVVARLKPALMEWLQRWDDTDPVATEQEFIDTSKQR